MSTISFPQFRISQAALGRRLASVLLMVREGTLSEEEFYETLNAVYDSCVDEDYTPDPEAGINTEVYEEQRQEIEKSVRRSEAARKAARRRREQREKNHPVSAPVAAAAPVAMPVKTSAPARLSRKKDRGLKRRLRKNEGRAGDPKSCAPATSD